MTVEDILRMKYISLVRDGTITEDERQDLIREDLRAMDEALETSPKTIAEFMADFEPVELTSENEMPF